MARTSSPAFDEHESPTAKRAQLDAVDLANAANRTQQLNPRKLLGDKLDQIEEKERQASTSDPPGGRTSGTQPVVSADAVARYQRRFELPEPPPAEGSHVDPKPTPRPGRWIARVDGRVLFAPRFLVVAIVLSLVAGFFAGGLR